MFVGEYEHALDSKSRVVLPAAFRDHIDGRGYVTPLDGCLGLWTPAGFTEVAEKWKAASEAGDTPVQVFRMLTSKARDVKVDAAGRMTLPRELLDGLGIESRVVIAGRWDRAEIWAPERFERENAAAEGDFEELVRELRL